MGKKTTVASAAFLAIGGFLFGYDSGIITSTIVQPRFVEYFERPDDNATGGIVSSFQGGAILGTMINFVTSDTLGRKKTIFTGAVIATLGCALQAGAMSIPMMIVGRFIAGTAVGILTSTIPMYAGEISEARHRGVLSGLLQWFLSWGFLVAQWLGYGCSFASASHFQWRFPLAFQCLPAVILLCGVWFLQEPPRCLVERERYEEAYAALKVLRRSDGDKENGGLDGAAATAPDVELEFREIRDTIAAESAINQNITWASIFRKSSWRRRLLLGCGVQAFSPLSGINVLAYYSSTVYKQLGFGTRESLMIIGISGALAVVYNTIGLWAIDRVGRVKPLIASAAGCALSLLALAAMSQNLESAGKNQLRAMVAINFTFGLFFIPTGIISWVYPAEIFPVDIRAKGNSLSTFTNWTLNLAIAQISPAALSGISFRYFYIYFVFGVIATACYALFYPETRGKTLEQMDELFGDAVDVAPLVPPPMQEADRDARRVPEKRVLEHVESVEA